MPCRSDEVDAMDIQRDTQRRTKINKLEAMLCAVLTAANTLTGDQNTDRVIIERIDEKESGVTRAEVHEWWKIHREQDEARRVRERAAAELATVRQNALNKLTDAEKKALNLK